MPGVVPETILDVMGDCVAFLLRGLEEEKEGEIIQIVI